jgi:hypothetical protein
MWVMRVDMPKLFLFQSAVVQDLEATSAIDFTKWGASIEWHHHHQYDS